MYRSRQDGFVYFASPNIAGPQPIKIGWSENPYANLCDGKRWHWLDLYIRAVIRVEVNHFMWGTGAYSLERLLHEVLLEHRIRGEWYRENEMLLRIMKCSQEHGVDLFALAHALVPKIQRPAQRFTWERELERRAS
jgi:hypothetical protein